MDETTKHSIDGDKDNVDSTSKAAPKRKVKKNLREKRRSTGVIIMPETGANNGDDMDPTKANTLYNEEIAAGEDMSSNYGDIITGEDGNVDLDELVAQLNDYKYAVDEWQQAYAALNTELETLRETNQNLEKENTRLKTEYDALMKVVKLMKK